MSKKKQPRLIIMDRDTQEEVMDYLNEIQDALPHGCEEDKLIEKLMDLFREDDLLTVSFFRN